MVATQNSIIGGGSASPYGMQKDDSKSNRQSIVFHFSLGVMGRAGMNVINSQSMSQLNNNTNTVGTRQSAR